MPPGRCQLRRIAAVTLAALATVNIQGLGCKRLIYRDTTLEVPRRKGFKTYSLLPGVWVLFPPSRAHHRMGFRYIVARALGS